MWIYIIRRLSFGVVLILLSTVISFAILKASPGSAIAAEDDPQMSREYIEQQKRLFGLDRHPVLQYMDWLGVSHLFDRKIHPGLLQGDLQQSSSFKSPVASVIRARLPATLALNLIAFFVTWLVSIPLGTWAALRNHRMPDKIISSCSFLGMSLPGFFLALLLMWYFAGVHDWLPPGGLRDIDHDKFTAMGKLLDYARHMVIPVFVLTIGALASLQRITRGSMLEVLRQQYVTTARAKGLDEMRVVYRHAMRNALNPLVTMLGFEFAGLFGGSALLENVLNYPGLGQLFLEGLRSKDQCLVMAAFLIGGMMLVLGNLLADLLLAWIDPRIAHG